MLTRTEADAVAESAIHRYARECEVETPDDVRRALELLISKASLAIEKYCGRDSAERVVQRALLNLSQRGTPQ